MVSEPETPIKSYKAGIFVTRRINMSLYDLLMMDRDGGVEALVDLRALEYISSYDEHLMCPICHCPFICPVRLQCDHVFCQKCLNTAIKSIDIGPNDFPCPSCRAPTKDIFMNVPRLLINMCDDVHVRCPYSGEGCKEILPRGHVQSHVDKYCEFRLMDCPSLTCAQKTRKKNISPENKCLHGVISCDACGEGVMEQVIEVCSYSSLRGHDLVANHFILLQEHMLELCPSLRINCPDCDVSIFRSGLQEHVDACPEAIHPCQAAKHGCGTKLKSADLSAHERGCPLIMMGPYIEAQNSRIDSLDMTIRQLKQRNEILEDGISNIRSTLMDMARTVSNDREIRGNLQPGNGRDQSRSRSRERTNSSDSVEDRSSNLYASNTTTYLLSLHESLREEVSQLSLAVSDLDARASMAIMNESLRIKEDMAHTNAAVNSMRMQVHWLMNPRLHQGRGGGMDGSSVAAAARGAVLKSQNGVNTAVGAVAGPSLSPVPSRRLSDSSREGTKL